MLGFDTGTLKVKRWTANLKDAELLENAQIRFHTSSGSHKIKTGLGDGGAADETSSSSEDEDAGKGDKVIYLPVEGRYRTSILVRIKRTGLIHRGTAGVGVLWLRDLQDNATQTVRVRIWKGDDYSWIQNNYLPTDGDPKESGRLDLEEAGTIDFTVCYRPGISDSHQTLLARRNPKAWEEYVSMKDGGWRKNVGQRSAEDDKDDSDLNTVVDPQDVQEQNEEDFAKLQTASSRTSLGQPFASQIDVPASQY